MNVGHDPVGRSLSLRRKAIFHRLKHQVTRRFIGRFVERDRRFFAPPHNEVVRLSFPAGPFLLDMVQVESEVHGFNQEPFFLDKVESYKELCLEKGGTEVKLSTVTTPCLKDPALLNCPRKPESDDEEGVMCKWCRHAFALKQADDVPFSNGRLVHCAWCDVALDRQNLSPPMNLAGQLSKGNKSAKHSLPSLAAETTEVQIKEEYDAVKLANLTVGPVANLMKKRPAEPVGDVSIVNTGSTDLSTIVSDTLTGITDGDSRSDYVDKVNDNAEVGEYIQACAAKITSRVKAFGEIGRRNLTEINSLQPVLVLKHSRQN